MFVQRTEWTAALAAWRLFVAGRVCEWAVRVFCGCDGGSQDQGLVTRTQTLFGVVTVDGNTRTAHSVTRVYLSDIVGRVYRTANLQTTGVYCFFYEITMAAMPDISRRRVLVRFGDAFELAADHALAAHGFTVRDNLEM
ncbi:hypothetical protein AOQ84DRAFT_71189 [Glonium stellatum]|uniref:Uncharacterized protein n=1 Tax=Glonium stellatum TaxID=574774 RepID=A0A8E2EXN8_9PEZI|nr:hypothetical protein AOQ84DRAFT_71189 [Glonium stellatum]